MPAGEDPADLVQRAGPEEVERLVSASIPFVRFRVLRALETGDLTRAEGKDRVLEEVREVVTTSDGRPLVFEVWRGGEVLELTMVPRRTDMPLPEGGFETRWLVGVTGAPFFTPETRTPGPIEALAADDPGRAARRLTVRVGPGATTAQHRVADEPALVEVFRTMVEARLASL